MNILKFVCLILFVSVLIQTQTEAFISIDIETDELHQIGEILVANYLEQQRQSLTTKKITSRCKGISKSILQLFGVTLSLVGANLLTMIFESGSNSSTLKYTTHNTTIHTPRTCKRDFGCDDNICWRSCPETGVLQNISSLSWCFASPKPKDNKFHRCDHNHDCSPCWPCMGACHSEQNISY